MVQILHWTKKFRFNSSLRAKRIVFEIAFGACRVSDFSRPTAGPSCPIARYSVLKDKMGATPEQIHEMFSYCIGFAQTMLEKAGNFYPFGATLAADGVVAAVGGDNGDERPNPIEIYKLLSDAFVAGALNGQFAGVALAANVNIPAQYSPTAPDGLRVQLESSGYARYVYVPYRMKKEGIFKKNIVVEFDEPFSVDIAANFFVST